MLDLFRRGPPPLPRPPAKGARVRVAYNKRGPWFGGEVLESQGKVIKVRLDEAGVVYYVRQPKRWIDQELRHVLVAAPEEPIPNGRASRSHACCSSCAHGKACSSSCSSKRKGKGDRARTLTRKERAEVTRAQQLLARSMR